MISQVVDERLLLLDHTMLRLGDLQIVVVYEFSILYQTLQVNRVVVRCHLLRVFTIFMSLFIQNILSELLQTLPVVEPLGSQGLDA